MSPTRVSVVIPTYNHGEFLGEAIVSVLNQTYPDFELVIVNDGSTDDTPEVVQHFHDQRIKYLEQNNRGAPAARNTGIRASSGEFIALLDADDRMHPEKLARHIGFLQQNPEIGASYNGWFELNHSATTIREMRRPPLTVSLSDLVKGFPFAPGYLVVRRNWLFRVNLYNESYTFYGDDLDLVCRLALAGCRFAAVDRALNYRRRHSGRIIKNLPACVESAVRPLCSTFSDPRCAPEVLALHDVAYANHYMGWAALALSQGETIVGKDLIREVMRLNPSDLEGEPCALISTLLAHSISDEALNHEEELRRMCAQLPEELDWMNVQFEWAAARGCLLKGARAVIWDRYEDGMRHFTRASELGAEIDESYLSIVTEQLLSYDNEFGARASEIVLQDLGRCIRQIGAGTRMRRLRGYYYFNRALRQYQDDQHRQVIGSVLQAVRSDLSILSNRGAISITSRSLVRALGRGSGVGISSERTLPRADAAATFTNDERVKH